MVRLIYYRGIIYRSTWLYLGRLHVVSGVRVKKNLKKCKVVLWQWSKYGIEYVVLWKLDGHRIVKIDQLESTVNHVSA